MNSWNRTSEAATISAGPRPSNFHADAIWTSVVVLPVPGAP